MLLRIDQPWQPETPQPDQVVHPENPEEVPAEPTPPEIGHSEDLYRQAA